MNKDNWYRGDHWDPDTQDQFERKLKKSKNSYNKAEYLRIKGSSLLSSYDDIKQEVGCKLLNRVIEEYPNETSSVLFALEQLGDYYTSKSNYLEAESNYRQCILYYKKYGRSGSSGIADIKLAETVIKSDQTEKFNEMYILLSEDFAKTGGSLSLNDDMFRYYSALAKLSFQIGKVDFAKQCAKRALELSENKFPQFDKYPELGIIRKDKSELYILSRILHFEI